MGHSIVSANKHQKKFLKSGRGGEEEGRRRNTGPAETRATPGRRATEASGSQPVTNCGEQSQTDEFSSISLSV